MQRAVDEIASLLDHADDRYLRERKGDVDDVVGRVQNLAAGELRRTSSSTSTGPARPRRGLDQPFVVAQLDWHASVAFVTDAGSWTYHTAILARSMHVPAVVGVPMASRAITPVALLAVGSTTGDVMVDPGPEVVEDLERRSQKRRAYVLSAATLLRGRSRRRAAIRVVLGSALLQVVVAAVRQSGQDRLHGPFVNPDHFAGYLEMALALAFGALWAEVLTNRDRAADVAEKAERFERRFPALAVRVLVWALIAAGIALTESRGAHSGRRLTTLVLLGAAILHRRSRAHGAPRPRRLAALLLGTLLVATAVGAPRFYRFLQSDPRDLSGNTRVALWKTSIAAWREFPIVGSGLGTFREAFRRVQPRELKGLVEQAHNDLLQLAVTGGAVGRGARRAAVRLALRPPVSSLGPPATPRGKRPRARGIRRAPLPDAARPGRVQPLHSGHPGDTRLRARSVHGRRPAGLEHARYLRPASNGTATVIQEATAFPPFWPGSKSHWRTAATAA